MRWKLVPSLAISATLLLVFGQTAFFPLLTWDDHVNITNNPYLNPPSLGSVFALWTVPYAGLYAPVTYTFWAGEAALAGRAFAGSSSTAAVAPLPFHVGNLALHAANSLLVWVLLKRLFGKTWVACLAALVFALHPLQAETVSWVTETKGLLCALFSLIAILQFDGFATLLAQRAAERRSGGRGHVGIRLVFAYAAAIAAFVLALLSKPTAVSLPLIAWLIASWPRAGNLVRPRSWQLGVALASWIAIAACQTWLTRRIQIAGDYLDPPGIWQRPLVAADALAFYLWKLLVPISLSPDYGRSPTVVFANGWAWWTWIAPAILVCLVVVARKSGAPRAALVSFAALLPALGLAAFAFQRVSTTADRYAYLALLGPALVVAISLVRWPRNAALVVVGFMLPLLAILSFAQARHWRSDEALYSRMLQVNPSSCAALNGLGNVRATSQQWADALVLYRRALAVDAKSTLSYYNSGGALAKLGRTDEAIAMYRKAIALSPQYENARAQLVMTLVHARRWDEAIAALHAAINYNPQDANAWANLGQIYAVLGRRRESIEAYRRSLAIHGTSAEVREELRRVEQSGT